MSLHRSIIRHVLSAPMPLADLQAATQVSLPTLRRAVQELTDARWIHVVGQAEANGGRPAMLFGIDSRLFLVVGLHLQLPGMRLIATDLSGQVLDESKRFNGVVPAPSECIPSVEDYLTNLQAAFPDRRILGIGIAAPGFIDLNTGDIISIGRVPTWENFPICRRLQAATGIPVHIANDVDCMAVAEFQYTRHPLDKNMTYFGFDEGVKVSLFFKGELFSSSLGNAGLIAGNLLRVTEVSEVEEARNLLTVVGVNQIFEQSIALLDGTARSSYAHILATTNPRERLTLILGGAADGLPICREIARSLIAVLAVAVANVILIIQPDVVVIGGLLSAMSRDLFAELETATRKHVPALISHNTIFEQGRLVSRNSAAIGANYFFLQDYVTDAVVDLLSIAGTPQRQ